MNHRFACIPLLLLLCAAPFVEAQTIGPTGVTHIFSPDLEARGTRPEPEDIGADRFRGVCQGLLHADARAKGEEPQYCGFDNVTATSLHGSDHFSWTRRRVLPGWVIDFSCSARMSATCKPPQYSTTPVPPDNDVPPANCFWPERCTPIVIDLRRDGFEFTDRVSGVVFDLTADGAPESTAWTAARADDAFLVLDRNGNGTIDDGSELFGNVTPQPPASQPNGYEALAVFDENGDGSISAADPVFNQLRLWLDSSHDGMSQPQELASLRSAGIEAISLDYRQSRRRDVHGNLLRYWSRVDLSGQRPPLRSVDVIFLAQ